MHNLTRTPVIGFAAAVTISCFVMLFPDTAGGYRVLGLNADDANNAVGFDGQLRGLILTATIFR